MSRITPPAGKTWNQYSKEQADAAANQSADNRRLVKRNIKLNQIAKVERQAGGNTSSPSYRQYNKYSSPGTVSPVIGHPWTT